MKYKRNILIHKLVEKIIVLFRYLYGAIKKVTLADCGNNFLPTYPLVITGGKNISVGDNFTSMGHNYLYGDNGNIAIGDNLSLNTNVQIGSSGGKINIGNNVLIGPNVVIRAANHGILRRELIQKQAHEGGEITIGDDVWIGANAVILKNVRLGKGCVIAAGAVVNEDVKPYMIVGGVPAKVISERV